MVWLASPGSAPPSTSDLAFASSVHPLEDSTLSWCGSQMQPSTGMCVYCVFTAQVRWSPPSGKVRRTPCPTCSNPLATPQPQIAKCQLCSDFLQSLPSLYLYYQASASTFKTQCRKHFLEDTSFESLWLECPLHHLADSGVLSPHLQCMLRAGLVSSLTQGDPKCGSDD